MLSNSWDFLLDENNRNALLFIGGAISSVTTMFWVIYQKIIGRENKKIAAQEVIENKNTSVTVDGKGNTVITDPRGPVHIGVGSKVLLIGFIFMGLFLMLAPVIARALAAEVVKPSLIPSHQLSLSCYNGQDNPFSITEEEKAKLSSFYNFIRNNRSNMIYLNFSLEAGGCNACCDRADKPKEDIINNFDDLDNGAIFISYPDSEGRGSIIPVVDTGWKLHAYGFEEVYALDFYFPSEMQIPDSEMYRFSSTSGFGIRYSFSGPFRVVLDDEKSGTAFSFITPISQPSDDLIRRVRCTREKPGWIKSMLIGC